LFGNPTPRIKSSNLSETKEKSCKNSGAIVKDFDTGIGEIGDFRPERGFLNML
jgi:hypothetical protein